MNTYFLIALGFILILSIIYRKSIELLIEEYYKSQKERTRKPLRSFARMYLRAFYIVSTAFLSWDLLLFKILDLVSPIDTQIYYFTLIIFAFLGILLLALGWFYTRSSNQPLKPKQEKEVHKIEQEFTDTIVTNEGAKVVGELEKDLWVKQKWIGGRVKRGVTIDLGKKSSDSE